MGKSYKPERSQREWGNEVKHLERRKNRSMTRELLSRIKKGEDPDEILFDERRIIDPYFYD